MMRVIAVLAICSCSLGLALRIWQVNDQAPNISVERYAEGDWVDMDGAFCNDNLEMTDGYSVRVSGVETMSVNEYLDTYAVNEYSGCRSDTESIVVLTLDIKNVDADDGGLSPFDMRLLSEDSAAYYIAHTELWASSEKFFRNEEFADYGAFGLVKGSTYTVHIPYESQISETTALLGSPTTDFLNSPIHHGSYKLILSNAPVRKQVELSF